MRSLKIREGKGLAQCQAADNNVTVRVAVLLTFSLQAMRSCYVNEHMSQIFPNSFDFKYSISQSDNTIKFARTLDP